MNVVTSVSALISVLVQHNDGDRPVQQLAVVKLCLCCICMCERYWWGGHVGDPVCRYLVAQCFVDAVYTV